MHVIINAQNAEFIKKPNKMKNRLSNLEFPQKINININEKVDNNKKKK